jgi:hypothetical protein
MVTLKGRMFPPVRPNAKLAVPVPVPVEEERPPAAATSASNNAASRAAGNRMSA